MEWKLVPPEKVYFKFLGAVVRFFAAVVIGLVFQIKGRVQQKLH